MNAVLDNAASLRPFLPELILCAGVVLVLGVGLLSPPGRAPGGEDVDARSARRGERAFLVLTLLTLAASAAATVFDLGDADRGLFGGLVARDAFADYFKLLFASAAALVALGSHGSTDVQGLGAPTAGASARDLRMRGEWSALLLALVLGSNLMAAASDLLLAYLAVELVSLLSYVLTALSRTARRSSEAALKYVIYGGAATAAMLYGFSLLFGLAGSTELTSIRLAVSAAPPLTVAVAGALCLVGFAFKMAVVPFHSWCPDVYQGAPTPVAALLSVVPKAAGFALGYRFLLGGGQLSGAVGWLATTGPAGTWTLVMAALAVVTMTVGNLAALAQSNLKRLLAYSSIAHAGTVLMALAVGTERAGEAMLLYLGVYLFMNLAAFWVLVAVTERGVGESLADFVGLGRRAPGAVFCLVVALFSLTGLPPTAGFVAKYAIFAAVIDRGMDGGGAPLFALALIGVLNTVVSLVYYARVIRVMVLEQPAAPAAGVPLRRLHAGLLAATTLPVILLGIYTAPLADLAAHSLRVWSRSP